MSQMPLKLKIYVSIVILIGLFLSVVGIGQIRDIEDILTLVFFSILAIVSESLTIRIKDDAAISVGFAIGLSVGLILPPFTTAIMAFAGFLLCIEKVDGKYIHILNSPIYKRLFNGGAFATSTVMASWIYHYVDKFDHPIQLGQFSVLGILLSISTYTVINIIIISILMALIHRKSLMTILKTVIWSVKNFFGLAPLGIIIALAYESYGWFAVLLFFGPLLLARYSFKLYMDMRHVYFETIKALSNAVEAKDQYTNGHSYRVADYAVAISETMGFNQDEIDRIKTAAILHDIGKIGISDTILNKPGQLEENEYLLIQKHPEIGAKILSEVEFLRDVSKIIKYHHERFDGKGYPEGLKNAEIPMEASILAVADAYDAMTSDRPYRKAMDCHTAMNILIKESGIQFNPIVVKAFRDYLSKHEEEMAHVG